MRLRGRVAIAVLLLLTPCIVAEAETVTGVVFHDRNGNGLRDSGEAQIAGVRVSNGREIASTDASGQYRLPIVDDSIIFVIKPSGWMTPVDTNNIPRFYYIHSPKGYPTTYFKGIDPTGPLPASVDFPLRRNKEPKKFRAIVMADPQTAGSREIYYLTHDIIEELAGTAAAFGVTLGDVAHNNLNIYPDAAATVGRVGITWRFLPGNHDTNYDGQLQNRYTYASFERAFGPTHYSFDYARVHFIVLNNICWKPPEAWYEVRLTPDRMTFLKNDLAMVPKDQLVVLMMHIPLNEAKDREDIFRLLEGRPHTFSMAGHWHKQMNFLMGKAEGWNGPKPHHHLVMAAASGILWMGAPDELGIPHAVDYQGTPNGYSIISFDGSKYSVRYKVARRPADYQMNVYAPDEAPAADASKTIVFANVFSVHEKQVVEMRLDRHGPWTPMQKSDEADPSYLITVKVDSETTLPKDKKLPPQYKCPHLWKLALPEGLTPGAHLIEVRTTDLYGQTLTGHRIIRVG